MTLQGAEARLSELNTEIDRLLREREKVLREWNTAFWAENQDNIVCIDEKTGDAYKLYLVNGDSKMFVCDLTCYDMKNNREDFYKRIDTSMRMVNIAYKRDLDLPDYQKNLVYAKAIEIWDGIGG